MILFFYMVARISKGAYEYIYYRNNIIVFFSIKCSINFFDNKNEYDKFTEINSNHCP